MNEILIPEFRLMGLMLPYKTTNLGDKSAVDCGNLWREFQTRKVQELITDKLSDEIFAVYFNYEQDNQNSYSFFIGCNVKVQSEQVPDGLSTLTIPTQNYFKISARGKLPESMRKAWRTIGKKKIPRAYLFDFDVYGEKSDNWEKAEVEIFVSIK